MQAVVLGGGCFLACGRVAVAAIGRVSPQCDFILVPFPERSEGGPYQESIRIASRYRGIH